MNLGMTVSIISKFFSKHRSTLIGAVIGAIAFVAPTIILTLIFVAFGGTSSRGAMIGFSMFIFWFSPIVILFLAALGLGAQFLADKILRKYHSEELAIGVWVSYPLAVVIAFAVVFHHQVRTAIASLHDYSAREIAAPEIPIKRVLLGLSGVDTNQSRIDAGWCNLDCVAILNSKTVESIAVPMEKEGGGFAVFRLQHGQDCALGVEYYRESRGRPRTYKRARELAKLQKVSSSGPTDELAGAGYFDRCISHVFQKQYEFDIRINYGKDFRRPYGPCCNVAEVHENRNGDLVELARWESKGRKDPNSTMFRLIDVASKVLDRELAGDITHYTTLKTFPFVSAEQELARMAALAERGAYFHSWQATTKWLRHVLGAKSRADNTKKATLSTDGIRHLWQIASINNGEHRSRILRMMQPVLDEEILEELQSAETAQVKDG